MCQDVKIDQQVKACKIVIRLFVKAANSSPRIVTKPDKELFSVSLSILLSVFPCKFLPHENYWDWELRGPCRKNLHYL